MTQSKETLTVISYLTHQPLYSKAKGKTPSDLKKWFEGELAEDDRSGPMFDEIGDFDKVDWNEVERRIKAHKRLTPVKADPESFVHRVQKNYDVRDKDTIQKRLDADRKAMRDESGFTTWGYPPGVYWKERDQAERAKEMVKDWDMDRTTDVITKEDDVKGR